MSRSMRNQQGITLWGFLFVAIVFVIVGMVAFKLFPIYNENMGVKRTLNQVREMPDAQDMRPSQVEHEMLNKLYLNDVRDISRENFKDHFVIERTAEGVVVHVNYNREAHFAKNVYLLVKFQEDFPMYAAEE